MSTQADIGIDLGWKKLTQVLQAFAKRINERTVIVQSGSGLNYTETPAGVILALSGHDTEPPGSTTGASAGGAAPTEGAWVTIDVMDSSCNRSTIQVWSKPAT